MLGSYLVLSLRRLQRYPLQSATGIICLTVGLAVCLLIGLFLRQELSFDSYHPDADRLYRANWVNVGSGARFATFFNPVSPVLAETLPQVADFTRIAQTDAVLTIDGVRHFPTLSLVDPQYFELFAYDTRRGDTDSLADLATAVLTEAAATELFGGSDVVGETFTVNDGLDFRVGAVVSNNRANSHLISNIFLNIEIIPTLFDSPNFWDNTGSDIMYHYLQLAPGVSPDQARSAILDFLASQSPMPQEFLSQVDVRLQSLRDIHFTTDLQNEMSVRDDVTAAIKPHRQWSDVYLFSGVAILTLTIAVFNYVNLQLAMASLRARELGVRRVVGASKLDLVVQFLVENLFMCVLALLLAAGLSWLFLGYFNSMVAAQLSLSSLLTPLNLLTITMAIVLLALCAGAYPAYVMAGLAPALALRGQIAKGLSATRLRSGLVIVQFAISIGLVISAGLVNRQLDYAMDTALGFDPDNVVIVDLSSSQARQAYDTLRSELLAQASVESVSAGSIMPTQSLSDGALFNRVSEGGLTSLATRRISVSDDYFATLGMDFVSGRALSSTRPGDLMPSIGPNNLEVFGGVVFNETAARAAGWDDPLQALGQNLYSEFSFGGNDYRMNYTVVGVVSDAHYGSLRNEIGPLSFTLDNTRRNMIVKVRDGAMQQALVAVDSAWQATVPDYPINRLNLEEEYTALYASENRTFILFIGLAAIAIIMACFGLYGLASLIAETRRKEISIRKVLGATVRQLMIMFTWNICRLVLVANVLAWPAAWWVMQNWLSNFAYRTTMDISVFIVATLLTLSVALLTILHRAWSTAMQSPVHALRAD